MSNSDKHIYSMQLFLGVCVQFFWVFAPQQQLQKRLRDHELLLILYRLKAEYQLSWPCTIWHCITMDQWAHFHNISISNECNFFSLSLFRNPLHTCIKWNLPLLPCFSLLPSTWSQLSQVSFKAQCVLYAEYDSFLVYWYL